MDMIEYIGKWFEAVAIAAVKEIGGIVETSGIYATIKFPESTLNNEQLKIGFFKDDEDFLYPTVRHSWTRYGNQIDGDEIGICLAATIEHQAANIIKFWKETINDLGEKTNVIKIDEENSAEEWWAAARACDYVPPEFRPLLDDSDTWEIKTTTKRAERIMEWASGLPGWMTGPEYAITPIFWIKN